MAELAIVTLGETPIVPPALYDTVHIGELSLEKWGVCDIFMGLSKEMVEKLVSRTLDTTDEALTLTLDAKRFASSELYESWYAKSRTAFVLIHRETGGIMALVWIGEKLPEEDHRTGLNATAPWSTLAYRSYPPYRGTGFMTMFTKYVLGEYKTRHPNHHFWAQIDSQNEASLHFAKKLGFIEKDTVPDAEGKIFMTYVPDTL